MKLPANVETGLGFMRSGTGLRRPFDRPETATGAIRVNAAGATANSLSSRADTSIVGSESVG